MQPPSFVRAVLIELSCAVLTWMIDLSVSVSHCSPPAARGQPANEAWMRDSGLCQCLPCRAAMVTVLGVTVT